jgi:hypothetical protein
VTAPVDRDPPVNPSLRRGLTAAVLILLVLVVPMLIDAGYAATLHIPRNYNEGWNALYTRGLLHGLPLYRGPVPFLTNNYPPLSFYIVAAVTPLAPDALFAGRAVAAVSLLIVLWNVGAIAARLTGSRLAGWFAALLVVATVAAFYSDYVAMDDPQLLGHVFMTSALRLLVWRWDSNRALGIALLIMAIGGLVKHNLLALPLATVITAAADSPRRALGVLAAGIGLVAVACALLAVAYGAPVFHSILGAHQQATFTQFAANLRDYVMPMAPVIALASPALLAGPDGERGPALLIRGYAAAAFVTALLFAGGAGVSYNIFFELLLGAAILAADAVMRVDTLLRGSAFARSVALLPFAGTVAILLAAPYRLLQVKWNLLDGDLGRTAAAAAQDIRVLAAAPGPVACEDLALCFWAGKELELDFFNSRQAVRSGRATETQLLEPLREHRYGAVQIVGSDPSQPHSRVSRPFLEALHANYTLVRRSPTGFIYVPR